MWGWSRKGAIVCNDTPGFLGNRIGVYAMQVAMTEAFSMKLSIEEADAILATNGNSKNWCFWTLDLIESTWWLMFWKALLKN